MVLAMMIKMLVLRFWRCWLRCWCCYWSCCYCGFSSISEMGVVVLVVLVGF